MVGLPGSGRGRTADRPIRVPISYRPVGRQERGVVSDSEHSNHWRHCWLVQVLLWLERLFNGDPVSNFAVTEASVGAL